MVRGVRPCSFDGSPEFFDGVQVGAVWRKEKQFASGPTERARYGHMAICPYMINLLDDKTIVEVGHATTELEQCQDS